MKAGSVESSSVPGFPTEACVPVVLLFVLLTGRMFTSSLNHGVLLRLALFPGRLRSHRRIDASFSFPFLLFLSDLIKTQPVPAVYLSELLIFA